MEGTIYLKRDKENQSDTSDSMAQSGGVFDDSGQVNTPEESEEIVSEGVVNSTEDVWGTRFHEIRGGFETGGRRYY